MQPIYIVMVGLPGSGKSYIAKELMKSLKGYNHHASTDAIIEMWAAAENKTYDEVWPSGIDSANKLLNEWLERSMQFRDNIIHDQTNLTMKKRRRILSRIPKCYNKVAIVVDVDDETQAVRLAERVGKSVPAHILESMRESFRYPVSEEGFDAVLTQDDYQEVMSQYLNVGVHA